MSERYITAADVTAINVELTALAEPTLRVVDKIVAQKWVDDLTGKSAPLDAILAGLAYATRAHLLVGPTGVAQIIAEPHDGDVGDAVLSEVTFLSATPTPTPPVFGGGGASTGVSHSVTWHHDAGTPSGVPFDVDLTSKRIGDGGWLGDKYAHQYFGPSGAITLNILFSNKNVAAQTLHVQEILETELNTDFSAAPKVATIGSVVLPASTNGYAQMAITPQVPDASNKVSIFYYYAEPNAGDVRIMGVRV